MHQLIHISKYLSIYRGFSITRLPRNKVNKFTRYQVSQSDQSYGKFDAQAQATSYIDELHNKKGKVA